MHSALETLGTPSRKPWGSQIPHPDPTLRTTVNKDYEGQLFQCTTIRLYLKMCVFRDVKDYRSLSSGVELTTVLQIVTDSVKCLHTDSELSAQMGVNNFIFFCGYMFWLHCFLSYMVILKCTLIELTYFLWLLVSFELTLCLIYYDMYSIVFCVHVALHLWLYLFCSCSVQHFGQC